ncbi:uncharacterized protein LOC116140593 [Pistacia vera]|uniref:uncharacterized protein LOC116140593 n=1 Tax=Pistacia vera TaxID=55513 RepID=UPI001263A564|nr:uncharacterized protein LOC116140593 [Pistacia vera]
MQIPLKVAVLFQVCNLIKKQAILSVLNFNEGKLPIAYLEVPLITRKHIFGDCKSLLDKILARIKSWRSHFLSYIEIEATLRAIFWDGTDLKKTKAKVAWDEVCVSKDEEGLGIMRIGDWNKAAMMRHLWNITQMQSNSGWIAWVKSYLLRENWHPKGPLLDTYGDRIVNDSSLSLHAKVKEIIGNRGWKWPSANSWELMEMKALVNFVPNDNEDKVVWIPNPLKAFSIWEREMKEDSKGITEMPQLSKIT